MQNKTITLCMIVKNEEETLERCVSSLSSYIDEFIIVDTGSTDTTINIIKKNNWLPKNQIPIQIEFEDFVITKNKALDYATSDYILWMDADEYLQADDWSIMKMFEYVNQNIDYLITDIQDVSSDNSLGLRYTRPRLWKNLPQNRFDGPGIHEYARLNGIAVTDRSITVYHKHKTSGKNYNERFKFYIETLNKYLKINPKDTRAMFYKARTYKDMQLYPDAINCYKQYLDMNSGFLDEQYQSLIDMADSHIANRDLKNATESYRKAITLDSRRAEGFYRLAKLYFNHDLLKAKEFCETALRKVPPMDVVLFLDKTEYFEKPLDLLSLICWQTKNYKEGCEAICTLIKVKPDYDTNRILKNKTYFDDALLKSDSNIHNIAKFNSKKFYTINNTFEQVYLINRFDRPDRLSLVSNRLKNHGIAFTKIDATIGDLLTPLLPENNKYFLNANYLACLLSHLRAVKEGYDSGAKSILILEDDVLVHYDIVQLFNKAMQENPEWDLLYLGHMSYLHVNDKWVHDQTIRETGKMIFDAVDAWGGHAYCMNRFMMETFLNHYKEPVSNWIELDRWFIEGVQKNPKYKSKIVYPQLFTQSVDYTDNMMQIGVGREEGINLSYSTFEDYE